MGTRYRAFQVGCPLPEHSKLGLTNERKVNSRDSRATRDLPFAHWSTPNSNVEKVDNQPEKNGSASASAIARSRSRTRARTCAYSYSTAMFVCTGLL